MYEVASGHDTHEADNRDSAIEMAKDLSESSYGPVIVTDEGECERLTYRNGSLTKYWYDTRHRR